MSPFVSLLRLFTNGHNMYTHTNPSIPCPGFQAAQRANLLLRPWGVEPFLVSSHCLLAGSPDLCWRVSAAKNLTDEGSGETKAQWCLPPQPPYAGPWAFTRNNETHPFAVLNMSILSPSPKEILPTLTQIYLISCPWDNQQQQCLLCCLHA